MFSSDDFVFVYGCLGLYLGLSLVITRRVARAMAAIAEPLLVRCFGLDGAVAQGLVRGLVVGFYLLNLGLIFYRIEAVTTRPDSPVLNVLSKLGVNLLVLGVTYYLTLAAAARLARSARQWIQVSRTESDPE